jgi:hypothetical protein
MDAALRDLLTFDLTPAEKAQFDRLTRKET